jgi:hypothetical protein
MSNWAILSSIEGNLAAYEAVLADIKRQRTAVEDLYILGNVIAPVAKSVKVIQRLRSPKVNEPVPQVCQGWWEEQLLILHGLGRTGEPTELIEQYGINSVKTLWDAIPREMVEWIRSLEFGFFELDCLLTHGSSMSVSDELTLLTLIVSLETIVLISQNRLSEESEKRTNLNLQIALLTEHEVTRVLQMLDAIQDKMGIENDEDSELADLEMETKPEDVLAEIARLEQLTHKMKRFDPPLSWDKTLQR